MLLVYPVLACILWIFVVMLATARVRWQTAGRGEVSVRKIALSAEGWPERAQKWGNNLNNQFQTPAIFFALCGLAIYVGADGLAAAIAAWFYVAARLVHTFIHTGTNYIPHRFAAFVAGVAALVVLWAIIVLHII